MPELIASGGKTICNERTTQETNRRSQARPEWILRLKRREKADTRKAAVQLADTLVPYLGIVALMYLTIAWNMPYVVTLLLAIPASGLMVRLFIFFHDCSHGSYLPSPRATKILGTLLGTIVFMPFVEWRRLHVTHHATSGNLDRRGVGDVWTMTVREYCGSSRFRRLSYRLYRHPLIMFGFGSFYVMLAAHRRASAGASPDQIRSVRLTNLAIAGIVSLAVITIGLKTYLMIMAPLIVIAGAAGIWLFYVQHQFDPSYWAPGAEWDATDAALIGSSYYRLPRILQWFSGNIGFHHLHHLCPRIPNYNLERAYRETREVQIENPLTIGRSLKAVRLNLWDEERRELISFGDLARRAKRQRKDAMSANAATN